MKFSQFKLLKVLVCQQLAICLSSLMLVGSIGIVRYFLLVKLTLIDRNCITMIQKKLAGIFIFGREVT